MEKSTRFWPDGSPLTARCSTWWSGKESLPLRFVINTSSWKRALAVLRMFTQPVFRALFFFLQSLRFSTVPGDYSTMCFHFIIKDYDFNIEHKAFFTLHRISLQHFLFECLHNQLIMHCTCWLSVNLILNPVICFSFPYQYKTKVIF